MKSQLPTGVSGLRGQGPDTLSRACRPPTWIGQPLPWVDIELIAPIPQHT